MPGNDPRIVIVGAGPAGLSAAYFLRRRGYRHVLVLEKLGRVGGLVYSLTVGGRAFDLGANYVTPEYRETLGLAREVGAEMYTEKPFVAMTVPTERRDRGLSGSSSAGGCRDQGYTVATTPFRAPAGTSRP